MTFFRVNTLIWIFILAPNFLHDGIVPDRPKPDPFARYSYPTNQKAEIKCLAQNIYFEARGEPYEGRVAIGQATLNRIKHSIYPTTICEVVYQPGQFTWTTQDHKVRNYWAWYQSLRLAKKMLANKRLDNIPDNTNGAVSFHVISVNPDWHMVKTVTIGHHVFYKIKEPVAQTQQ